jgi:hypothetical protein
MTSRAGQAWIANIALVTVSVVFGLGLIEIGLRLFYPKYEHAAEALFNPDSLRITTRPPNARRVAHHPDNGKPHPVIYNNLGMRQHRDFRERNVEGALNVGFFGDSYLENATLPGPYSFTEPLDYLLNRSGSRFNVLNFGQDGYGTDQSFITYRYSKLASQLVYVFYVFCINDIRNIYENDLFFIDNSDQLQRNPVLAPPWWIRLASRLHTTYLIQDGYNRIKPRKNEWEGFNARILQEKHADKHVRQRVRSDRAKRIEKDLLAREQNPDVSRSLEIFQAILREWKDLAAANGAAFSVVLLPTGYGSAIKSYIDDDIPVIDLYELFSARITDYDYRDWRFENDGHWAEAANSLAASLLYRDIARKTGLEPISEQRANAELFTYYSAFDYGWAPKAGPFGDLASSEELQEIRRKYAVLEFDVELDASSKAFDR